MVYGIWVDADGLAGAEYQTGCETLTEANKEVKDLRAMDCGKIVLTAHLDWKEADAFAEYLISGKRPVKVLTALKRFTAGR